MKVKEIERTANMAWSPSLQHPVYLAAGTAAQQLDATFSTTAALEIYQLNLSDEGMEMPLKASLTTENRFDKLVWSKHGMPDNAPNGIIIGGVDNGNIILYDAAKLLNNEDGIITTTDKHTGAVRALDVNPFQSNLLASGSSDSEIYIWDLNNPVSPMTPGAKSQPPDDISCLAWNRQVQHILASTSPGGRSVVWDLRKNEPIIKITDHSSRIQCKAVAWHPEIATQLVLASEDDHSPVIQMWDLRFATSPLKVLENHQRGVLAVAWCPQDPDLLLSCAKDNRILCWNPNSAIAGGEVVYELPTSTQWCFDVNWCPRNPAVISTSSFDGHISIYSLMGGGQPVQQQQQRTDKIAESFPGAEPFTSPEPVTKAPKEPVLLKKPPKWLRTPVGATFGFGGKLVTFETTKQTPQQQQQQQRVARQVHISQVVTENDLLKRSTQLEATLQNANYADFCNMKISNAKNEFEAKIWNFLKVNFEKNSRERFLSLLGYDPRELSKKLTVPVGDTASVPNGTDAGVNATELAEKMELLAANEKSMDARLGSGQNTPSFGSKTPDSDAAAAFDVIASHGSVEVNTGKKADSRSQSPFPICTDEDADGLISQSLLAGNFEAAVEICLKSDRLADAIVLAIAGGTHLLARTQRKYFEKMKTPTSRLISAIVTKDWSDIVNYCELENWTEALAALMTYSKAEEFSTMCDTLGKRLENEQDGVMSNNACLCYICSGNIDNLVACWTKMTTNSNSPQALQDLIEKVMILKRAVEMTKGRGAEISSRGLANKLSEYAKLLAAQGSLATAMQYLGESQEQSILELRDRLYKAQGDSVTNLPEPPFPFKQVTIRDKPEPTPVPAQTTPQQYQQGVGVNSFQTTTVSSSQYSMNQVTSQARQPQQPPQQPQQQYFNYEEQIANQPAGAYQTTPSTAETTTTTNIYSKQGGFGKYPQYPQSTLTQGYNYPGQTGYSQAGYAQYGQNTAGTGYAGTQGSYNTNTTPSVGQTYMNTGMMAGNYGQPAVSTPGAPNMATPSSTTQPPPPMGAASAPGWNDPPLVRSKKPKSATQPFVAPEPITTPIFGVPQEETPSPPGVNQDAPGAPTAYGQTSQVYNTGVYQQQQQQQQQNTPAIIPPTQLSPTARTQPSQPEPEPPKEKAPIPTEHQVLCDTFDGLTQRCTSAAKNPQMKRKLDDVNKRLNALYDKLRDNTLSPNVLSGLHEISQAITNYDYQHGLGVHQQIVASGNFSEIGTFMPGLKVLMQVATQLRV